MFQQTDATECTALLGFSILVVYKISDGRVNRLGFLREKAIFVKLTSRQDKLAFMLCAVIEIFFSRLRL